MTIPGSTADALNRGCDCTVTDIAALHCSLQSAIGADALPLADTHPHLFSDAPVFVDRKQANEMRRLVEAVHRVAALPSYVEAVLSFAPPIARIAQPSLGVFNGFDFHITPEGPRLIEVNTNAGGAMLNAFARALQSNCCAGLPGVTSHASSAEIEAEFMAMFLAEWRLSRPAGALETLAIVDDDPGAQYLHPEFLLFRQLFERNGIRTFVVDPSELEFTGSVLTVQGDRIDLVYNRLTDFYFEDPRHRVLRQAYEAAAVVVTPNPRAHALLASKRTLALLSDGAFLRSMGAADGDVDILTRLIPRTLMVEGAEEPWWNARNQWFFKPTNGFGSRGAYRGDKMTRRVFGEVVKGGYVAQELSPPGERRRSHDDRLQTYKVDVRAYAYEGATQLFAARLYQGQTTNFRTAGGGFAPVFELDDDATSSQLLAGCRPALSSK